jgi:hypothetical protein
VKLPRWAGKQIVLCDLQLLLHRNLKKEHTINVNIKIKTVWRTCVKITSSSPNSAIIGNLKSTEIKQQRRCERYRQVECDR